MRPLPFLLVVASAVGITACMHQSAPELLPVSNAVHPAAARAIGSYRVLHNFNTKTDAQFPQARLMVYKGRLYGTGYSGGTDDIGAIFEITTSGSEHVVHNFKYVDGSRPVSGLRFMGGALYGTTSAGGAHGQGTVFRMTPSGKITILHSFKAATDGMEPLGDLSVWNGAIYGTTYGGGGGGGSSSSACYAGPAPIGPGNTPPGCGTIFKVTASGHESRVSSFWQDGQSGYAPAGPLSNFTPLNGLLYGTTAGGPQTFCTGTVYSVDSGGQVKVVYYFGVPSGCSNGDSPVGDLVVDNAVLYGATYYGGTGANCAGALKCGAVFSITSSGKESVIYSFQGAPDGYWPTAGLTLLNGKLFGVTSWGGSGSGSGICGILFKVTTSGQETILHNFGNGNHDGCSPVGGLVALHGTLYGTTSGGGLHGAGTVFAFTP